MISYTTTLGLLPGPDSNPATESSVVAYLDLEMRDRHSAL
jgi:hypothetical protein